MVFGRLRPTPNRIEITRPAGEDNGITLSFFVVERRSQIGRTFSCSLKAEFLFIVFNVLHLSLFLRPDFVGQAM